MKNWWAKLRNRFRVLRQLRSAADAWLLIRIACFASLVPLLLRLKLSRLDSLLQRRTASGNPQPARAPQAIALIDAVIEAGAPMVRRGCLTRGITLYYFLRRAGVAVQLCFGLGKIDGEFVGHCWLVKDGTPYLEKRDPTPLYALFYTMPGAPATTPASAPNAPLTPQPVAWQ